MFFALTESRKRCRNLILVVVVSLVTCSGCQSFQPNTVAGGVLGTAMGGLTGAAIGSHQGKAGEGALIGALVGGTTGGVLGNQADRAEAAAASEHQAAIEHARQQAVSLDQVVQMTRSGLSDDVIINQIRSYGTLVVPTTSDLIVLKSNGVSDRVVAALQSGVAPRVPVAADSVVVREVVPVPDIIYATPFYAGPCYGPARFHHPRGRRCHGSHFGVTVGF